MRVDFVCVALNNNCAKGGFKIGAYSKGLSQYCTGLHTFT
jgi:hypothetical protein